MTASLYSLVRVLDAARRCADITIDEHDALLVDLTPALIEAFTDTSVRAFVDLADDPADPWGVLVCVDFPEARDFGPVVLRYAVPEWQRGTCQAAHGGFDERMARVEWAEGAFYCAAFHPPREVQGAILDRVHAYVESVGRETLRERVALGPAQHAE